jgi:hypothetical protein
LYSCKPNANVLTHQSIESSCPSIELIYNSNIKTKSFKREAKIEEEFDIHMPAFHFDSDVTI